MRTIIGNDMSLLLIPNTGFSISSDTCHQTMFSDVFLNKSIFKKQTVCQVTVIHIEIHFS